MSRLIVKKHRPGYWIRQGLLVVVIIVAASYALFRLLSYQEHQEYLTLQRENLRVVEEIQRLELENRELRDRQAVLERASQVEHEAYLQHVATLQDQQEELIELKKQIVFYQGLTSPEALKSGVNIEKMEVMALDQADHYHFMLLLTRVLKNGTVSRGTAQISISGVKGGEEQVLSLEQVSTDSSKSLVFKFKYFQNLEGDIKLPSGFQPREISVSVDTGGKQPPLEEVFDWPVEEKS